MKISSFICVTNAVQRGDTFIEAILSHLLFSDELIVVDGGSTDETLDYIAALKDNRIKVVSLPWPQTNWSWTEFAAHWNFGYTHCTGDWVAQGETDHIFHERDIDALKQSLAENLNENTPCMVANKFQSSLINKWHVKAKWSYFVNKKNFGDRIGYGHDKNYFTDLAWPIFIETRNNNLLHEGQVVSGNHVLPVPFYNYLWTFKTLDMICGERIKANIAWNKFEPFITLHCQPSKTEVKDEVREEIIQTLWGKYDRGAIDISLSNQPQIMIDKINKDLKPGMVGYNLCGLLSTKWANITS